MFIERRLTQRILSGAKQSPVVSIVGPRQAGKSTLTQKLFSDYLYLDMQDSDILAFANKDPKGFLEHYKNEPGIIIDEAQYAPNLFSQIKVAVDKNPRPGYYILSGSQNFLLHEKISESLAGRVYSYKLLPLSIAELKQANLLSDRAENQIYNGFYPRVYQSQINAKEYYKNYISTYVERDIRSIKNLNNILMFEKFMKLCALRVGTILNLSDLAAECEISVLTARSWLTLLETSFILFFLPSYHNNLGKRLTKSPKLYFYDVGLAATLMGIGKETMFQQRAIYGALFENMIVVDLIKNLDTQDLLYNLSFFRDSNKYEIDLIIELDGKTIPVEIKASETMNSSFFDNLAWFQKTIHNNQDAAVVYGGDQTQKRTRGKVISWKDLETISSKNT
jgi:Predicted ATPase (AAA+ superfamily)